MHHKLADLSLVNVRKRIAEGDCPITPAYSVEFLEHLVDHFADRAAQAEPPDRLQPG